MKEIGSTEAVFESESKMGYRLLVEGEKKRRERSKSEGGCKRGSSPTNRNTRLELEGGVIQLEKSRNATKGEIRWDENASASEAARHSNLRKEGSSCKAKSLRDRVAVAGDRFDVVDELAVVERVDVVRVDDLDERENVELE